MKAGKEKVVWLLENSEHVPVKLIAFPRGNLAEIEYTDQARKGKRKSVMKVLLKYKKP